MVTRTRFNVTLIRTLPLLFVLQFSVEPSNVFSRKFDKRGDSIQNIEVLELDWRRQIKMMGSGKLTSSYWIHRRNSVRSGT